MAKPATREIPISHPAVQVDIGRPYRWGVESHSMQCEECGAEADYRAAGWRAYRNDEPEDEEPIILVYCPACAEREFGRGCQRPGA
jgi:hypothetical protein